MNAVFSLTMAANIVMFLAKLFLIPVLILFFIVLLKINKLLDKLKNKYK